MQVFDRFLPKPLHDDPDALRRGRLLVGAAFSLAALAAIGLAARLSIAEHPPAATAVALLAIAAFAAAPWVLRATGSLTGARLLSTAGLFLLVAGMGWFVGGIDGPVLMVAPLFPFLTTFLFGVRLGTLSTLLMLAAVVLFALLPLAGVEMPLSPLAGRAETLARGLTLSLTVALAGVFAALYEQQRRFTEEHLRRSQDLYRRIFSQSKDVVALSTPDGRLVDVNRAGIELFGYDSKEEMIGRGVTGGYVDPRERRRLLALLEENGYVQNYESTHRTRTGELRILEGTTSTVRNANGAVEFLVAILHDVTDKRRAEAEREAMLAELDRKNRELEEFTYAISHDLRSPLTTVRGFLGLLEKHLRAGDPEKTQRYVETMDRAADKMSHMLEDLLDLSRIGKLRTESTEVPLAEVTREAVGLVAGRIRETGAIVDVEPGLPSVRGDRKLLLAIFQNLVDNAVKFSATRCEPRIRIGHRAGEGDRPDVFFVEDNGVGIDPKAHRRVFGVFQQLDPETGGTGIGLATVQRAVEAHRGRVWVECGDRGSTFCFTIPDPASRNGTRETTIPA